MNEPKGYHGRLLDLTEKIIDKHVRQAIMEFDDLSPEDKIILLENYCMEYYKLIGLDDVQIHEITDEKRKQKFAKALKLCGHDLREITEVINEEYECEMSILEVKKLLEEK